MWQSLAAVRGLLLGLVMALSPSPVCEDHRQPTHYLRKIKIAGGAEHMLGYGGERIGLVCKPGHRDHCDVSMCDRWSVCAY